jgi:hypothetical protein
MDSNSIITVRGIPLYAVAFFEFMTNILPTIILWLSFLYGVIQLYIVCRQLFKESKSNITPS